jgi:hypothetical protein
MKIGGMRISPFWLLLGGALLLNLIVSGKEFIHLPLALIGGVGLIIGACALLALRSRRGLRGGSGKLGWFMRECVTKDMFMLIGCLAFIAVVLQNMFKFSQSFYLWAFAIGFSIIWACFWYKWREEQEFAEFRARFSEVNWRQFMHDFERAHGMGAGAGSAHSKKWSHAEYSARSGMRYEPRTSDDPFAKPLYKILEVEPDVSDADLKTAYHKLAMKWHPDKNPGDKKAEARFKDINIAYEVLHDADGRSFFDRIHGHNQK